MAALSWGISEPAFSFCKTGRYMFMWKHWWDQKYFYEF